MRYWLFGFLILALGLQFIPVSAQSADLATENVELVEGIGDFGQPILSVSGTVLNTSPGSAYANLMITAQAFDAADTLIGEGFGYPVNQCGIGLLPDFALQPGHRQPFTAPLELFEADAEIERVEVQIDGEAVEARTPAPLPDGISAVSDAEIASVEWDTTGDSFRFAVGCPLDVFTEWTWYQYAVETGEVRARPHPQADVVTDDLLERLGLDAAFFARSLFTVAPNGDRAVFQDEINDVLTSAPDGRFQRLLYNDQHNRTLQGIYWLPDERFLAYYFGAYGDPVLYFTADGEARRISRNMDENPPSEIVPGVSRDGRRIVVAGTYEEQRGYFLYVTNNNFFELLFPAEPPGNNTPSPLPLVNPETDLVNRVIVALEDDGENRLVCFNRDTGDLIDLAPLPFQLAPDERAQWWISPDERHIALAATGARGGLWVIDLAALPSCA